MPVLQRTLSPGAAVICDLHLDLGEVEGGAELVRWLTSSDAQEVVILGDLFDVWVGPAQAQQPGAAAVLDALREVTRAGREVFVLHGNRDFLLGSFFTERTGATLCPDGLLAEVGDKRILFVHGDELCTLDKNYQRLRAVVRSGPVTWLAPRLPLALSGRLARRLRRVSTRAVERKPALEKRMQRPAAEAWAAEHRADLLVCGHAHEFRDEELDGGARWIVLDAFGGGRDVMIVEEGGGVRFAGSGSREASASFR